MQNNNNESVRFVQAVTENGWMLNLKFHKVDTSKVWWEIRHGFCCKFRGEYNGEKILKICQQPSKLWTNV